MPVETQQKIKEVIEPALMKTRIDGAAISPAVQELIQQALQPVNQQLEAAVAQKQTAAVAASTSSREGGSSQPSAGGVQRRVDSSSCGHSACSMCTNWMRSVA